MSFSFERLCAVGAVAVLASIGSQSRAQTALPAITVIETTPLKARAKPRPAAKAGRTGAASSRQVRSLERSKTASRVAARPDAGKAMAPDAQGAEALARTQRENLLPKTGANRFSIDRAAIETLPQGDQTSLDRVLLQAPGVSQDSAASGDLHIRNEHANLQYRINGVLLPDGVSGFSQVLDTSVIRSLDVIDGALPAQFGLHTAGIIDIQTRNGADNPGGTVGLYGGSHGTIVPTLTYSGTAGAWDYFFTGRFVTNSLGIENPTDSHDAIHDRTQQGRAFLYASGLLEDASRVTVMAGTSVARYQIPNTPGVAPSFTAFGVSDFDSKSLGESQVERSTFAVIAWQKSFGTVDSAVSYFSRYSSLHFVPDTVGDLVFNGVSSDVTRTSLVNGVQSDNAYRFDAHNTVRFGFTTSIERAQAINASVVLPTDPNGNPIDAPFAINDAERNTSVVAGVYLQDEVRLTPELTLNGGVRFDMMHQYGDANQLSPRVGLVYRPAEGTVFHAGYARYFTPPELALSTPTPLDRFANTTAAPDITQVSAVKPERSHYFDAGVTQTIMPGLEAGVDLYYKIAKNLLDDGQFGQALVLTAFNYDHAYNDGVELKVKYEGGDFRAYGNVAVAQQRAKQVSSNQYLFGSDEISYIQNHYVYTDHDQLITASGGVSYLYGGTRFSVDAIYGSGLRDGFANIGTVSPYVTINVGATHEFKGVNGLPLTARISVVNLLDHPYEIRDGSGIGVFAAQYGERRGVFAGLTQRF